MHSNCVGFISGALGGFWATFHLVFLKLVVAFGPLQFGLTLGLRELRVWSFQDLLKSLWVLFLCSKFRL